MPDPRFFEDLEPATLAELAALTGAQLTRAEAGDRVVRGAAILALAGPGTVTFLTHRRMADAANRIEAAACFVSAAEAELLPPDCVALITPTPQGAYAIAAARLHRPRPFGSAAIADDAHLEPDIQLGFGVVIGPGAQIGRGTQIGPNTVIGPGVAIGRDCRIAANVTIGFALIGDRVQIHAGVVIGQPGFGAVAGPKGVVDVPQLGRVILQDSVTVGANSTIDRGAFEDTVVGENTKIDNLVQIAHNVRLGRNCVMAAQSGLSGSVTVGDGVAFGGRAGIADHVTIGDGARIAGASGVMRDIAAGEAVGGTPARSLRSYMRETAWLTKMANLKQGAKE